MLSFPYPKIIFFKSAKLTNFRSESKIHLKITEKKKFKKHEKNRLRNTNEKDDAGYFLKVSKKNLTKKHFFNNFTGYYCTQIRAIAKHIL